MTQTTLGPLKLGPLKLGMVGGGHGAFIGGVHRMAARLDGRWDLVAGAFSSDPARAHASAADLGISPDRSYADFTAMAEAEAAREDGIDAVAIVTPNSLHAPVAMAFLAAGIHVICDKPMTATLAQAETLAASAKAAAGATGAQFILTHNYTGTPMIRQARAMIAEGALGDIRIVEANYLQDWLADAPTDDNKQAAWRTDPAQSGGGAIGDIGTHAHNLASFVTGLRTTSLRATLTSHVAGRAVDDDARVTLAMGGAASATATGHIWASQVAVGHENNLTLAVYGSAGALHWAQENPNQLRVAKLGQPPQIITRGSAAALPPATSVTRIPAGHPEGYLEAFATIYREAADLITGNATYAPDGTVMGIAQGLDGMRFIDGCQRSSANGGTWVDI